MPIFQEQSADRGRARAADHGLAPEGIRAVCCCARATDCGKSEADEVIQFIPQELVVCWCSQCLRYRNKLWKFKYIPQERVQLHRGADRGVPVPQITANVYVIQLVRDTVAQIVIRQKRGGDPACALASWSRSWPSQCHRSWGNHGGLQRALPSTLNF